jgi:hypothetical protein
VAILDVQSKLGNGSGSHLAELLFLQRISAKNPALKIEATPQGCLTFRTRRVNPLPFSNGSMVPSTSINGDLMGSIPKAL